MAGGDKHEIRRFPHKMCNCEQPGARIEPGLMTPHPQFSRESDALAMMRSESRVREGAVPAAIGGVDVGPGNHHLTADQYLLREPGFACHYRQGGGVTVQMDDPSARGELELFLAGSVHAAIACLGGLYPFHGSAIAVGGGAVAFAGPSGAGKSTLVAALARRGLPLHGDDTLILDMRGQPPLCLPGHKRLKLWPEGLKLAGVEGTQLVSAQYPKFYVDHGPAGNDQPLPLRAIVFLEEGGEIALEPLRGAQRLARLADGHYMSALYETACEGGAAQVFRTRAALAAGVAFHRLTRPLDPARFAETLDFVAARIDRLAAP